MTPNEEIRRAQSKGNLVNSEPLSAHHANLCRSAQAIIEAARKPYDGHGTQPGSHFNRCRVCDEPPSKHLTSCALAAHAKNEQGTGEHP